MQVFSKTLISFFACKNKIIWRLLLHLGMRCKQWRSDVAKFSQIFFLFGPRLLSRSEHENVKCLDFSSHCGDRRSFLFLFGRHLGINLFPRPLTPADWIGIVWPNRCGAANNFVLLILHQYIGAANQLAPIYWCCKHLKNPRNFFKVVKFLRVFAYWCCHHK